MLVNFRFKNCRSFLRENNLSLEAVKDNELQELNTFHVQNEILLNDENELLKSVLIFGSNASGKTNVIKALAYMKNVLILSASQFPLLLPTNTLRSSKRPPMMKVYMKLSSFKMRLTTSMASRSYTARSPENGSTAEKNDSPPFLCVVQKRSKSMDYPNKPRSSSILLHTLCSCLSETIST